MQTAFTIWPAIGAAISALGLFFIVFRKLLLLVRVFSSKVGEEARGWRRANYVYFPELSEEAPTYFAKLVRLAGFKRTLPTKKNVSIFLLLYCGFVFVFPTLLYSALILFFLHWHVRRRAKNTEQKIIEQLPDALTGVAESLSAGFSFSQAVSFVGNELPEPIIFIFKALSRGLERGLLADDVFKRINRQLSIPIVADSFECIVAGVLSGGNIVPLLYTQAATIRAELRAQNELKSLTAAGRSSGIIIALLAPVIFLFFWVFSPSYAHIFVESFVGKLLLGTSIILEIIGFMWIQKITTS